MPIYRQWIAVRMVGGYDIVDTTWFTETKTVNRKRLCEVMRSY